MGPGSFDDTWQLATNFALLSDGTNHTVLNAGMPEGGSPTNSYLDFQIAHSSVHKMSNGVETVTIPFNHGFMIGSNYNSGQMNTNVWAGPISVKANVQLTKAAVSGNAGMQLWVIGLVTNTVGDATTASTIADASDFRQLIGSIPAGGAFVFTNNSTGAGNSSTLFRAEVTGD
jgi:hypothetical protein